VEDELEGKGSFAPASTLSARTRDNIHIRLNSVRDLPFAHTCHAFILETGSKIDVFLMPTQGCGLFVNRLFTAG
jgi:hypothetical protein